MVAITVAVNWGATAQTAAGATPVDRLSSHRLRRLFRFDFFDNYDTVWGRYKRHGYSAVVQ